MSTTSGDEQEHPERQEPEAGEPGDAITIVRDGGLIIISDEGCPEDPFEKALAHATAGQIQWEEPPAWPGAQAPATAGAGPASGPAEAEEATSGRGRPGRPRRSRRPARHVVSARLTEHERELMDLLRQGSRSEFMRSLLLSHARRILREAALDERVERRLEDLIEDVTRAQRS